MKEKILHEQQLAATLEAAAALNQGQAGSTDRVKRPPRPGDVFLSRRTADFPVEWLMVEEDGGGRVQVLPLDEHPYVGSRDLELSSRSLGGVGVVRCDLDAWLDASQLEPDLRTAGLSELELGRVRRRRRAIDRGTLEASLLEETVDGDPEYHQWRDDTLQPALATLTGELGEAGEEDATAARRRWPRAVAAAAVFLALALPLGWQTYRLSHQLERDQGRIAELEGERGALADQLAAAEAGREESAVEVGRLEQALSDALDASRQAVADQKKRFDARLRRAFDEKAVVNVPSFFLRPPTTRNADREPVVIDPGNADRFTLALSVPDPEPYLRYRLRIVRKVDGQEIWKTDKLVKLGGEWLRLDLPVALFEAEEYDLLIYGLGRGDPKLLEECYPVKFETE